MNFTVRPSLSLSPPTLVFILGKACHSIKRYIQLPPGTEFSFRKPFGLEYIFTVNLLLIESPQTVLYACHSGDGI